MKILVVNAGSSSLKYKLFDMNKEAVICDGGVERIGIEGSKLVHKFAGKKTEIKQPIKNHTDAFALVINTLIDKNYGGIASIAEIDAVGHRVLHAGEDFTDSVLITDETLATMEKNIPLGPLHMPANIDCIKSCRSILPDVPMVAVFDTAFHMSMPKTAYMYAIKYEDYEKFKVRKYGFHGTSHKYISAEAVRLLNKRHSKIVTCHLGNGSSVAAVVDGKCVDTSMGLTPLEGLVMGTRSGDIDPAVLEFLMDKKGMDIHQMLNYLNKESGFLGISGFSSDSRDLAAAAEKGDERACLALEMSRYRVKKYIGSYAAAMGGIDAIVFAGGIGENSAETRAEILKGLEFLGVHLDAKKNDNMTKGEINVISAKRSKVKVFVIPTNEELVIARDTKHLAG